MAKASKEPKFLLPSYVTIKQYADLMGVREKYIFQRIAAGVIVPEQIGMFGTYKMIDYDKYKDLEFRTNKNTINREPKLKVPEAQS